MKTTALIPARKGSKRIPNKNMMDVGGHPLIKYSIITALELMASNTIQDVYVSTDSPKIANYAEDHGSKIIHRPDELAQDYSSDIDFIYHTLSAITHTEKPPDLLVILLPTSPLRSLQVVSGAITIMKAVLEQVGTQHNPTSLRSVEEMSESAYKCFELEGNTILKGIGGVSVDRAGQPNQTFPKTYHPNGYVDIVRPDLVIRSKKAWGRRVLGYITPRITELDTPEDVKRLEYDLATKRGLDVSFKGGKIEHGKDIDFLDPKHKARRL